MTLLEYIAHRLMGEPFSTGDRSTWSCPRHEDEHPSFCTLPVRAGFKNRFRCWSCGFWGDEFDLLKELFPHDTYAERRHRLHTLTKDFETMVKPVYRNDPPISFRGGSRAIDWAFAELLEFVDRIPPDAPLRGTVLAAFVRGMRIAQQHGISANELANDCVDFLEFAYGDLKALPVETRLQRAERKIESLKTQPKLTSAL